MGRSKVSTTRKKNFTEKITERIDWTEGKKKKIDGNKFKDVNLSRVSVIQGQIREGLMAWEHSPMTQDLTSFQTI